MLRYIPILEHSWNTRPSYLHGAGRTLVHTKEKDVSFPNDSKVSLTPTQEGPFHVMFLRKQHTQEPKEPKVCDWNHLSLGVVVPAKLASKRDRDSELIQSHFAALTKTFEYESQNATKITSAFADSCIQSLWPVMSTLIMFVLSSYDHFSHSVLPSFFSQLCDHVVIKTDWCSQNERMVQGIN